MSLLTLGLKVRIFLSVTDTPDEILYNSLVHIPQLDDRPCLQEQKYCENNPGLKPTTFGLMSSCQDITEMPALPSCQWFPSLTVNQLLPLLSLLDLAVNRL